MRFDRTFGAYPISIATSLAIEGITHSGEYLERGPNPPINKMEFLMVNLRTIIRNAVNAFPSSEQIMLTVDTVYKCCDEDFTSMVETIDSYNQHCEIQLYVSTYNTINQAFKDVNFKKFSTEKQATLETIERAVVHKFEKEYKDKLKVFDYKLKGLKRCVILTHHPIDLLSYYDFPDLVLLESHTGVLKERKVWGSKLNLPKGCKTIPFNKPMLCIFGDKTFINGQLPKVKKALINVSEKSLWNGLTTVSKQIADCKRFNEIHLAEFIKQYRS